MSDRRINERLVEQYPDFIVNDEGDVIVERKVRRMEPSSGDVVATTVEVNLTTRYRPGRRTTSSVERLVIEAELTEETGDPGNAAYPVNEDVERHARARIEAKGLTPAWEVERE